jgi:prolyl-tRNA editing enzyme YbaK/EbsC (Cys-tRNA(Pro) deacylase)
MTWKTSANTGTNLMMTLSPADLERFLHANQIPGEIVHLETMTPTVQAAAAAVGVEPDDIVKSILFLVDGRPVLVIACGLGHVDGRALAACFGVGRKRVKLANPETVLRESGYSVGALPPFGHRAHIQTLLDRRVLEGRQVYAGGGSDQALLRISPQTILEVTQAEVLDLLVPSSP